MKFFSRVAGRLPGRAEMLSEDDEAAWLRDPLSHPELENMSPRELADLPFNRGYRLAACPRRCCG